MRSLHVISGTGEDLGGGSDVEDGARHARSFFRNLKEQDDMGKLQEFAERYRETSKIDLKSFDEFPVDPDDAIAIRQSLLPTAADPLMWCVRVRVRKMSLFASFNWRVPHVRVVGQLD